MSTSNVVGNQPVWPNYSSLNSSLAPTSGQSSLGKDDFLKILMAQLSNQDPMKPMDDTKFIAQMAQFSAVEQTMNMADEVKKLRESLGLVSGLIGKTASWIDTATSGNSTVQSGQIDAIILKDGEQYARISGKDIPLDQLTQIEAAPAATNSTGTGGTAAG